MNTLSIWQVKRILCKAFKGNRMLLPQCFRISFRELPPLRRGCQISSYVFSGASANLPRMLARASAAAAQLAHLTLDVQHMLPRIFRVVSAQLTPLQCARSIVISVCLRKCKYTSISNGNQKMHAHTCEHKHTHMHT